MALEVLPEVFSTVLVADSGMVLTNLPVFAMVLFAYLFRPEKVWFNKFQISKPPIPMLRFNSLKG
jgi:hypothetical protein